MEQQPPWHHSGAINPKSWTVGHGTTGAGDRSHDAGDWDQGAGDEVLAPSLPKQGLSSRQLPRRPLGAEQSR